MNGQNGQTNATNATLNLDDILGALALALHRDTTPDDAQRAAMLASVFLDAARDPSHPVVVAPCVYQGRSVAFVGTWHDGGIVPMALLLRPDMLVSDPGQSPTREPSTGLYL